MSPHVEELLMKDLLLVFQGLSGTHIKYDVKSEQYVNYGLYGLYGLCLEL